MPIGEDGQRLGGPGRGPVGLGRQRQPTHRGGQGDRERVCWQRSRPYGLECRERDLRDVERGSRPQFPASKIDSGAFDAARFPTHLTGTRTFSGPLGIDTQTPNFPLSLGGGLANSKLALWDGGPNTAYGFGVQPGSFRIHLNAPSDRFSFLNGVAGGEFMTLYGSGRLVLSGGMLARGGAPGRLRTEQQRVCVPRGRRR